MQMRAKCARFSASSSSHRLPLAVHVCASLTLRVCMCVCVSWPVATRSPRSVAFVTILNVSTGRQNEAKLAPIVATSVWLDILARARSSL